MPKCSYKNCKNHTSRTLKKDGVSYFHFPRDPVRCGKWISIIARQRCVELFRPTQGSVVCSDHFLETDKYTTAKGIKRLHKTAIPQIGKSDRNVEDDSSHLQNSNEKCLLQEKKYPDVEADNSQISIHQIDEWLSIPKTRSPQINISSTGVEDLANPKPRTLQANSPTSSLSIGSLLDTPKKTKLKKELFACKRLLLTKSKKISSLKKQNFRLKKRNANLKDVLSMLNKRETVDQSLLQDLSKHLEVADTFNALYLKNIKKRKRAFAKYPPGARKFAITLHFYSPAAYKYIRKMFDTCLPHPNTLCNWYRSVDAKPDITGEAFDRLKQKTENGTKEIIGAIIADEMSIRQQKIWTGNHYEGLVDMGLGNEDETTEIASQVYVIMLVGVNDSFKIPLAYFLITSLTAEVKANLLKITLEKCHSVGVKVVSLTFDGCKTNISCMKILGCNIDDCTNMKTHFKHPSDNYEVTVFLDACHMIKLMRNLFESKKLIKNGRQQAIKWDYIQQLHNLQEEKGLHLANKLSHRHIAFRNEIMKVKLATQLLSRSVAKAIEFCDKHLNLLAFKDSSATVEFIMILNNIFDVLNTRNLKDHGYKKPLGVNNAKQIISYLTTAKEYLISLNIDIQRRKTIKRKKESQIVYTSENIALWKCQANTGVVGLLVCIESLQYLYKTRIESGNQSFLLSYKFSQDHVELFFGNIRSQGGHNNNPNAVQVKSAYKKMLMHLELSSKFTGNAIPLENIPILSGNNTMLHLNNTSIGYRAEYETDFMNYSDNIEDYIQENCDILSCDLNKFGCNSDYIDQIVGYIAGNVVRHLIKTMRCNSCVKSLLAKEIYFHALIDVRNLGGLFYSSQDVFNVCKRTEVTIRRYQCTERNLNIHQICTHVLHSFLGADLFSSKCHDNNHTIIVLKSIIERYLKIRLHYIAKKESQKNKSRSKRQLYNKLNLFQGN